MAVSAAILTGGKSSRMGADKALLPWGCKQLLDHVIALVKPLPLVVETLVVGEREDYQGRGAKVVPDDFPGCGPLGGIATALRVASEPRVLVIAVDMPMLSFDLLDAMCRYPMRGDGLVPRVNGWQPLHAIYDREALPVIEAQIRSNSLKISDAFDQLEIEALDYDWIAKYDPDDTSFENANTPESYETLVRTRFGQEELRR